MTTAMNAVTGARGTVPLLVALALAALVGACDLDTEGLLDVDLPGNVTAENLETPGMATPLRNSAIGDFECTWDNYVGLSAVHSDEYVAASGNIQMARQMLRQITPDFPRYAESSCASSWGLFTPIHTARFMLESHFERLQGFSDEEVPERQRYMAEMRAYGGYVYVALGEGFCGTPLDAEDRIREPEELLQIAVDRFTEAEQLAQAGGFEDLENMALVGRARAHLDLGNYDEAIDDAEQVAEGFRIDATREENPGRRQNSLDGINRLESNRSGTVAPSYRDVRWKDTPDPRVNVMNTGFVGHDNATIIWRHDKVPQSRSDDVMIASHREAQMFIAEAAALNDDLPRARAILNEFHAAAGIPAVTEEDIPTRADVIEHVIEERRREFFVEGGHRLRDHLRWRGTEFEVPFLGEPGSDHPDGIDQYGQEYGTTTCYPVAEIELTGSKG